MASNGTINYSIRLVFGQTPPPVLTLQTGDYNSHTIQALCYTPSGEPMSFDGANVQVVYQVNGVNSPGYPVEVNGNILTFTLPAFASTTAGVNEMQVLIYGQDSYLQSPKMPYIASAAITPGPGGDDPVPALVLLVQQAQQAIADCTAATDKANETVADIEQKLADGAFIGPTGPTGPQGYQGIGVTSASLDDQGELVFTVTDPATGGSSTLPPVNIDTSAAIQSVNQAAQEGVQQVQAAQASAIAAVEQAGQTQITAVQNAGTQAVGDVTDAKNAAITDIGTAQSGAEAAITAAQASAVQTVQQAGTTAVGTVQEAQNSATEAISQTQQTAIDAVENEGDAQVQRLQEIIPQPSADYNGKVLAVENGVYQFANPAELVLNDNVIASTSGWSSLQIANALCPPFSVSGPIVQCTPLANYPLDVQVEITPTQEGTGDPSPTNIRPIVGWDSVNVWRGGKNLLDGSLVELGGYSGATGTPYQTDTRIRTPLIFIPPNQQFYLSFSNEYVIANSFLYDINKSMTKPLGITNPFNSLESSFFYACSLKKPDDTSMTEADVTAIAQSTQLELGSTATPYTPYQGDTYTIQLGQTVYGGTLDVGTGVMTVTQAEISSYNGETLPGQWISDSDVYTPGTQPSIGAQVVYELADPQTIQLTPQQIPAISGTNTLYADAGNVTVTGASDPIATITSLQNRVSALESAQTNM